jgi:hypothetical protein
MNARIDTERILDAFLAPEADRLADRVIDAALADIARTPQRRSRWPARRTFEMSSYARLAASATAVVLVAVVGYNLWPGKGGGTGTGATPVPTAQASPSISPSLAPSPNTVSLRPFAGPDGLGMCPAPGFAGCVEDPRDDSIAFTFALPAAWDIRDGSGPWIDANGPPTGAAVFFYRGNWLFSEPCHPVGAEVSPDIPVGPSVDDFVTALVDHPSLDVTAPVDITLAGYSGKYLDLRVPDDISECAEYQPIDLHIYAQGPAHRWHMWVLDVDGVRVVVESNDYAGTPPRRLAEAQAILDSLEITP